MANSAVASKLVVGGWPFGNGTNSSGFLATTLAYYNNAASTYQGTDQAATFWTSTPVANNTMKYGFGISNYIVNGNR